MNGLSVLTLAKGRATHLANLIEGLRRSEQAPDELVIADMGGLPSALPKAPFPIRIERIEGADLPLAAARNRSAASARCDRLLFLDVDCIPAARLITDISAALEQRDALICPEVLYLGPDDARASWREADLNRCGMSHPVRSFPKSGLRTEPNAGLFWSLAFGIRRLRFQALGGFDEAFTGYGAEDTDFGFRAKAAGLQLVLMAGPGAFHQHHPVSDPPIEHIDDIIANAKIFYNKWKLWPMRGWLDAFEALGLISLEDGNIRKLRLSDIA
ncbi:galactosyltransferase-related protein [Methylopila sp. M107]|uniref:glycosyltransferase family 2 protein n=1 Tax=Methylopila sp. M107 TaxID=1101190 RepID=UPI00039E80AA|nr:galactosyltransferase-related protein [Methylopila sp. M107]